MVQTRQDAVASHSTRLRLARRARVSAKFDEMPSRISRYTPNDISPLGEQPNNLNSISEYTIYLSTYLSTNRSVLPFGYTRLCLCV